MKLAGPSHGPAQQMLFFLLAAILGGFPPPATLVWTLERVVFYFTEVFRGRTQDVGLWFVLALQAII